MTATMFEKYLPLSEATYYVLIALTDTLHGYAIMQKVESLSEGKVTIGPGTMYGAFNTLTKQGLITMVADQDRRKTYALTDLGKQVLTEQIKRIDIMAKIGKAALREFN